MGAAIAVKILCTGDLHLGRRPSRLPASFDRDPAVTVAHVWERAVEAAIDQAAHAVVLTGDLVDRENRLFEAWGPLERGLARLDEAGIETIAVAGNHDHDVLPGLIRRLGLERVRLLGAGGAWETATLSLGDTRVRFAGFSFPRERVERSPLDDAPPLAGEAPLALGVVHGELDQPRSPYAPLERRALAAQPVDAWLLGHLHAPAWEEPAPGRPALLYPGSPQPLDPGEPGAHGPWLLQLAPGEAPAARQLPLATVRYEPVTIEAGPEEDDPDAFRAALPERVRRGLPADLDPASLRCVAARVTVTGATPLHGALAGALEGAADELELPLGEAVLVLEKIAVATRPALDLDELARGEDAAAELARLVRALDAGTLEDGDEALLETARRAVGGVEQQPAFRGALDASEGEDATRARLRRAALDLLAALRAQKREHAE